MVVTPHLGASTAEAQDKAGETIAEQVVLALRGDFVPFAVNVAASEASESRAPVLAARRTARPVVLRARRRRAERRSNIYEGEIADYDCRVLTLSILKGVLGPVGRRAGDVRERAAARGGARASSVRETKSADARDYVNLIVGARRPRRHARSPRTLFGKQQGPRIVGIDEHTVDLPPARTCSSCTTTTRPGMIGGVASSARRRGVNISDMGVGRSPSGEAALMVARDRHARTRRDDRREAHASCPACSPPARSISGDDRLRPCCARKPSLSGRVAST